MPKVRQTDPLEGTRFEPSVPLWDWEAIEAVGRLFRGDREFNLAPSATIQFI
jgi:hypothetical protein